jgi:hypothetical protein
MRENIETKERRISELEEELKKLIVSESIIKDESINHENVIAI